MADDHSPRPGAERPESADVTLSATAAVAAAIHDFGVNVLSRGPDADADHEAEIGRHILQAVDVSLGQPDSLRDTVSRMAADPHDDVALAVLHQAVQAATAADASLLARVEHASRGDDPVREVSGIPPRSVPSE